MSLAYNYNLSFTLIEPGCCNVPFLILDTKYESLRKTQNTWYCPNCGSNRHFTGKSEEQKLKEQLATEKNRNAFLRRQNEKERNRTRAQKAAKTRIKNRIANGVCPCCNRYFKNLHRHMQNIHPDYKSKED